MKKTAIILGATGLTGGYLLNELLHNTDYAQIKVFGRKSCHIQHKKLQEFIGDLLNLEQFAKEFTGDEVFCCIGTTKKKCPNKNLYHQIDYGIPLATAQLCLRNNIPSLSIISTIGANKESRLFYTRTKGLMENDVLKLSIPNILIYRPSLIYGKRKEIRVGEKLAYYLNKLLSSIISNKFKGYQVIDASFLAKKIMQGVNIYNGHQIIEQRQFYDEKNETNKR